MLKKLVAFTLIGALWLSTASQTKGDLIVTGLFDGPLTGGLPKVVELYSNGSTDLSQYGVGAANNGGGTDGVELQLSGSAADGDFIYIVDGLADFSTYFGAQIPAGALIFDGSFANGGAASINGDDAIELFFDPTGTFGGSETVTDVFGEIDVDGSGTAWDYLDGWAYRVSNTGPDGSTFAIDNWTFSGVDANDGQTDNASALTPFPIGTFSFSAVPEPTSAGILGLVALTGCLVRRRR